MSKFLTLLAAVALAACLAVAQDQPAQTQPGQPQAMPQTQPSPAQTMPQTQPPPQAQAPAAPGQKGMSSQQLQSAFERTFQKYPELSHVKATVVDDKIELSGTVPNQDAKDKLHRMAEQNADGRKVVDDKLKVEGSDHQ